MIVISRKKNESIVIGHNIEVTVAEILGNKVRLVVADRDARSASGREIWDIGGGSQVQLMLDPAWLTWNDGTVVRLAKSIAEARD